MSQSVLLRLLENSMPVPECGCWIWLGGLNRGYGQINIAGESFSAHRVSWVAHHNRPIPEGLFVCHHCDTRSCINPDHLFLGTHQDNIADALRKGRLLHSRRRLAIPLDRLPAIFADYAASGSVKKTGAHFGFNSSTVYAAIIRHRPELMRRKGATR